MVAIGTIDAVTGTNILDINEKLRFEKTIDRIKATMKDYTAHLHLGNCLKSLVRHMPNGSYKCAVKVYLGGFH